QAREHALHESPIAAAPPADQAPISNLQSPIAPHPWWQRATRWLVFGNLFKHLALLRLFSVAMALYQRSGIQWLARRSGLLKLLGLEEMESMLPPISGVFTIPQGQIFRSEGQRRYSVALLSGCIMSTAFAEIHQATIRVLQKNGC